MQKSGRAAFDHLLEEVLAELSTPIKALLDRVPLIVEDYPSAALVRELGLHSRKELCGLYRGIPQTERTIEVPAVPSDTIQIFREGIVLAARHTRQASFEEALKEQIRITVLHELGHHFGLDEDDLEEMGYG